MVQKDTFIGIYISSYIAHNIIMSIHLQQDIVKPIKPQYQKAKYLNDKDIIINEI